MILIFPVVHRLQVSGLSENGQDPENCSCIGKPDDSSVETTKCLIKTCQSNWEIHST